MRRNLPKLFGKTNFKRNRIRDKNKTNFLQKLSKTFLISSKIFLMNKKLDGVFEIDFISSNIGIYSNVVLESWVSRPLGYYNNNPGISSRNLLERL